MEGHRGALNGGVRQLSTVRESVENAVHSVDELVDTRGRDTLHAGLASGTPNDRGTSAGWLVSLVNVGFFATAGPLGG